MAMPDLLHRWTRQEVLALPDDGNRYELIDGELLVSPSPRGLHQRAIASLFRRVDPYVRAHRVGVTLFSPADLMFEGDQVVQPDLFVVPLMENGREPRDWPEMGIPLLIAEVLSRSTEWDDKFTKRVKFQRSGVGHYWIVDVDARTFEDWRDSDLEPRIVADRIEWWPAGAGTPFAIDVPAYFREVWGEESAG